MMANPNGSIAIVFTCAGKTFGESVRLADAVSAITELLPTHAVGDGDLAAAFTTGPRTWRPAGPRPATPIST